MDGLIIWAWNYTIPLISLLIDVDKRAQRSEAGMAEWDVKPTLASIISIPSHLSKAQNLHYEQKYY